MRNFPAFTENDAPLAARPTLARARENFGQLPAPLARYANSPALLQAALYMLNSFEHCSLSALEQEVVALVMAGVNGCELCTTLHLRRLRGLNPTPELQAALEQSSELPDARLEALRLFTLGALQSTGDVEQRVFDEFLRHGFTHEQALDVLLGIGAYTLTTFANRMTECSRF